MKRKTTNSPYPILYPEGEEYDAEQGYKNAMFDVAGDPEVTVDKVTHNLWIKFDFSLTEPTLNKLIADGIAIYYVNIECSRTYYRKPIVQTTEHFEFEIPYTDVSGNLEIFVGVVAAKDIKSFHAPGFADRFGATTFDLNKGDILAAGTGWNVELEELDGDVTPYFYVALDQAEGHNSLWVDGIDDVLRIYLNKDIYNIYYNRANIDKFKNVIMALVMKPAILSALQMEIQSARKFHEDDEKHVDVQSRRWLRKLNGIIAHVMERDGYSWDINTVSIEGDREPNTLSFAVSKVLSDPLGRAMCDINEKF